MEEMARAGAWVVYAWALMPNHNHLLIRTFFGWFLALRGLILLAAPQLILRGGTASMSMIPVMRIGFSILVVVGLWLTYVGWLTKSPVSGS